MFHNDDLEQKIKEKLLESLIEHMHGKMGDDLESKFPKKSMAVEVAAPDKEHLADGLDKAKDVIGGAPEADEGSDEDRLMDLLDGEKDDDDKEMG